jgi:hypothetical protein
MKNPSETLRHAIRALTVCRDRSVKCLDELQAGRIEEFLSIQRRQQIAFQNFKSLDQIALMAGQDIAQVAEATRLEQEIQDTHRQIRRLQEALLAEHQSRMEKLGRSALGMRNYGRTHVKAKFIKLI